jgi:hypothetical protein
VLGGLVKKAALLSTLKIKDYSFAQTEGFSLSMSFNPLLKVYPVYSRVNHEDFCFRLIAES